MHSIEAQGLSKRFGTTSAVGDLTLAVEAGEIFGFLGPNGAGKTTTIRMLTGVLSPDRGRVMIDGIDLFRHPLKAKLTMGVIPENSNVYVDLTAEQNLHLTGKFYGIPADERKCRADELLSFLGLDSRRNDKVRTFSKGMRQRISIGCAIIHRPRVLFLDEPTSGLDVQSKRLVIETIRRMHQGGSTIFLTTHNIEEANTLCQRVGIINRGALVATGRPEDLKKTFDPTQSIVVSFAREVSASSFDAPSILKAEVEGDKWRLFTEDPDAAIKYVTHFATVHHNTITSLHTSGPSLEEAFLQLTGEVG
jgi:ABC-2 type transport system ATP-binding protein